MHLEATVTGTVLMSDFGVGPINVAGLVKTGDEVIAAWREETGDLADVIALKFTEPAVGPAGRAIDLRLKGDDLERLKAASLELQAWMNQYAGVRDLTDDLRPGKREYRLRLRPEAGTLGLDARGVAEELRHQELRDLLVTFDEAEDHEAVLERLGDVRAIRFGHAADEASSPIALRRRRRAQ